MSSTGFDCTDVLAPTFPLAANKNVFPSPGTERVSVTWEFYDLFQRRQAKGRQEAEVLLLPLSQTPSA